MKGIDVWPWNIVSGADFLILYVPFALVSALVAVFAAYAVPFLLTEARPEAERRLVIGRPPPWDAVWRIAFLRGGVAALADALVVHATYDRTLLVSPNGLFGCRAIGPAAPIVDAFLASVGPGPASGAELKLHARSVAERFAPELERELVADGLLLKPRPVRVGRRYGLGLLALVFVVGLLRLLRGLALGRPVSLLFDVLLVLALVFALLAARAVDPKRQAAGAYLRWLEDATVSLREDVQRGRKATGGEAALVAALTGIGAFITSSSYAHVWPAFAQRPELATSHEPSGGDGGGSCGGGGCGGGCGGGGCGG